MNLADLGATLTAGAVYPMWGKVRGVGGFARRANAALLRMGATPIRTAKLETGANMRVDLRSGGQWAMFYGRNADRFWIDVARSLLGDDKLFLDVGANIGIYACQVAAAKRIAGQCHAFEPMPGNIARLRENISLNALDEVVTVYPFGLSDEAKTLHLAYVRANGADTGNAEIVSGETDDGRELFDIEVRRFDDVALPDKPVGVMKIDVEGHEDFAYRGGKARLAKDRPFIIAEYNRMELTSRGLGPAVNLAELPDGYIPFCSVGRQLKRLTNWAELPRVENFLICPEESISRVEGRTY